MEANVIPAVQAPASPNIEPIAPTLPWKASRYGFAVFFLLSLLTVYSGLRVVLFFKFHPASGVSLTETAKTFLIGLQRDVLVALLMTLPLLIWFLILPQRRFAARWHRVFLTSGLAIFWLVQVFVLFAEFFFFDEFKSRFNTVAVDYLLYPKEVFVNIWDSYAVVKVVLACGAVAGGWVWLARRLFRRMWDAPASGKSRLLHVAAAVVLCCALAPTVEFKGTRFSQERVLNEIANNGSIAFISAALTRHLDYSAFYKTIPLDEAYQRVKRLLAEPGVEFTTESNSIRKRVAGDPARPKLNVVILLEESLGSEFWGSLGRKGATLTPEMDKLANEEGMLFTNLYASGNRTVRGFEGVLSSFPPLPGDSIVKRDRSENVETIARILKRDGYRTLFLYGGRGLFDNMRAFTVVNGYERFIEQKHFEKPTFATVWGVCDEDLFARAIVECRELAKSAQPFLVTTMSVSNHKPYTFPKGRIPENPDQRKRRNAVKYSDYALGQFFKAARQESFWTNTVFVVVADHGARVYGSQSIPIHSYEIPLLVAGPAVVKQPSRVPLLGCSLDVAPTILGLIGRSYDSMFFGRDLLKNPAPEGRVLINHNRDIGLYAKERLVVLGLMQNVEYYQGDPKIVEMQRVPQPGAVEQELEKDATALYQVADDLYVHRRYRIDP